MSVRLCSFLISGSFADAITKLGRDGACAAACVVVLAGLVYSVFSPDKIRQAIEAY